MDFESSPLPRLTVPFHQGHIQEEGAKGAAAPPPDFKGQIPPPEFSRGKEKSGEKANVLSPFPNLETSIIWGGGKLLWGYKKLFQISTNILIYNYSINNKI